MIEPSKRKTELIQTRLEAEIYEVLKKIAERREMSVSQLTRRALKDLVEKETEAVA